ncbi:MAG: hypothetical protein GXP39_00745 [Chloroflexi bacterium]|nr:hypothetical protein [Chloroflexota bacterium]
MDDKKTYETPKLKTYGDVTKITLGPNAGWLDWIIGAVTTGTPGSGGYSCKGKPWPQIHPCSS